MKSSHFNGRKTSCKNNISYQYLFEVDKTRDLILKKVDVVQMQRRLIEYTTIFQEGFLDEQFTQLQQPQDESNPDFMFEVVSLFFQDSEKTFNELAMALLLSYNNYKMRVTQILCLKLFIFSLKILRIVSMN